METNKEDEEICSVCKERYKHMLGYVNNNGDTFTSVKACKCNNSLGYFKDTYWKKKEHGMLFTLKFK